MTKHGCWFGSMTVEPGFVDGGKLEHISGNLYLLHATQGSCRNIAGEVRNT